MNMEQISWMVVLVVFGAGMLAGLVAAIRSIKWRAVASQLGKLSIWIDFTLGLVAWGALFVWPSVQLTLTYGAEMFPLWLFTAAALSILVVRLVRRRRMERREHDEDL